MVSPASVGGASDTAPFSPSSTIGVASSTSIFVWEWKLG